MSRLVEYGGQNFDVRKVYYNQTVALLAGQVLLYDPLSNQPDSTTSASNGQQIPPYPQLLLNDRTTRLGVAVVNGNATTNTLIAGIVSDEDVGKAGPAWVDVIVPKYGDIIKVLCTGTSVTGTYTKLSVATADASMFGALTNAAMAGTYGAEVGIVVARAWSTPGWTLTALTQEWVIWMI